MQDSILGFRGKPFVQGIIEICAETRIKNLVKALRMRLAQALIHAVESIGKDIKLLAVVARKTHDAHDLRTNTPKQRLKRTAYREKLPMTGGRKVICSQT